MFAGVNLLEWRMLRRHLGPEILLLLALPFLVYAPVYLNDYFFHDDWTHLFIKPMHCGDAPLTWTFNNLGRPLANLWVCLYISPIHAVADGRTMRLMQVAFSAVSLVALYLFLRRARMERGLAWAAAAGAGCLPGYLVYNFWLGSAFVIYALIFATFAAYLTLIAPEMRPKYRRRVGILTVLLLLMSLLTYQMGAMLYVVLIYTAYLLKDNQPVLRRRLAVSGARLFVVAGALYVTWYVGSGLAARLRESDATRGHFLEHPGSALAWFFTAAWPRALAQWFPLAAWSAPGAAALLLLAGGLYAWRRRSVAPGLRYGLLPQFALVNLAVFAPVLLSSFRFPVFRALLPLSVLAQLFLFALLNKLPSGARRFATFLVVVGILRVAWSTERFTSAYFVAPAAREMALMGEFLTSLHGEPVRVGERSPPELHFATDELFMVSSEFPGESAKILRHLYRWQTGGELAMATGPAAAAVENTERPFDPAEVIESVQAMWPTRWEAAP